MKNVFLILLAASCSSYRPTAELSETSGEVPGWIYAPYEECSESAELCATGEAKLFAQADAQARNNLASIFEVSVKSEFNVLTSSSQNYPWQGAVKQEVQHSLQESVNQVLETVQIKKRYKHKGMVYSLAMLNRSEVSELLLVRLKKLDDELNTLWLKKSRTNLRRIIRLDLEREKINERYRIVSGAPFHMNVSFKDISAWKESRPKSESISLKIGQAPEWMTEKLKELLSEAGFRVVKGDSQKVISLNVDSIKEFLNVEGFEKYTFTMNLTSFENGEKNKVLAASETVTGRSQADALLKVKLFFNEYIEQHLSDLELD